jgi:CBS domain-containing membrane protein
MRWKRLAALLGLERHPASHAEKLISAGGAFVAMLLVLWASVGILGESTGAALVIASTGASAVLLFAVPHGALSQPWALFGGHLISAAVGVTCALHIPDPLLAAAVAVAGAIGAMYYLRCVHPPGGATALTAVMGGPAVHALGYEFLLTPVLLNVGLLFASAVAVNYLFPWRRYPVTLTPALHAGETEEEAQEASGLSHADLEYAMRQMDVYVDVREEELRRLFALATAHHDHQHLGIDDIRVGQAYSNARYDDRWAVREVLHESGNNRRDSDVVVYRVVAGRDRRRVGRCSRAEFARWARYQVFQNENSWQRMGAAGDAGPTPLGV